MSRNVSKLSGLDSMTEYCAHLSPKRAHRATCEQTNYFNDLQKYVGFGFNISLVSIDFRDILEYLIDIYI